jgi:hypothetical protein
MVKKFPLFAFLGLCLVILLLASLPIAEARSNHSSNNLTKNSRFESIIKQNVNDVNLDIKMNFVNNKKLNLRNIVDALKSDRRDDKEDQRTINIRNREIKIDNLDKNEFKKQDFKNYKNNNPLLKKPVPSRRLMSKTQEDDGNKDDEENDEDVINITNLLNLEYNDEPSDNSKSSVNPKDIKSIKDILLVNEYTKPKTFKNDGTYFVGNKDIVELSNNIVVKIEDMKITEETDGFSLNGVELYLSFFLKAKKINPVPLRVLMKAVPPNDVWFGYYFEGYGVRISLPTENMDIPVKSKYRMLLNTYELSFSSVEELGLVTSTTDLYQYCLNKNLGDEKAEIGCLLYSPYDPQGNEVKISNSKVSVIGPNEETVQWYFSQANACYNYLNNNLEIDPLFGPIPIRLLNNLPVNLNSGLTGIYLVSYSFNSESNPNICSNSILLHEMTHNFLVPAPIQDIFNEGLATVQEYSIAKNNDITMNQSNVLVTQDTITFILGNLGIKYKGTTILDGEIKAVIEVGILNTNDWISVEGDKTVGVGKAIRLESNSNFLPILKIEEISEDFSSIVVSLYNPATPIVNVNCAENGYYDYFGWETEEGTLQIETSNLILNEFVPLSKYLSEDYPYQTYYKQFYKTSSCFWKEIDEEIGIPLVTKEMQKYQNFKNEPFLFFEFLVDHGMDLDQLSIKYGITFADGGKKPYLYSYVGDLV